MNGSWAVMCCGCFRFLAKDGTLTKRCRGRLRSPQSIQQWRGAIECAAVFETKAAADAAARAAGWQTDDELGAAPLMG